MNFLSIQDAIDNCKGKVAIRGWCYRERGSNKLKFITLRDSSNFIQCVIEKEKVDEKTWKQAKETTIESSLEIEGNIVKEKRAPTGYEIHVEKLNLINKAEPFPITKDQSTEFLLDKRHLWLRSRKLIAVMKIRSTYVQARDEFFKKEKFIRFDAPILQPTQSEGGSTLFEVKYYDDKIYLSQSWQFYAEAAVFALERVYNMGPTFRAEKSKTSRHLSEFWMAEMEAAWFNLNQITEFAKEEIKYCIKKVAELHSKELKFLGRGPEELKKIADKKWPTIKYREALKILKEKAKMNVKFGKDLRTIEEDKLMEHFDTPIVITHYPIEAMAFYKPQDPNHKDEALCFDMLAPEAYGEIVGGSQRSTDIKEMKKRLKKQGEKIENYEWYFDLRKYGSIPHSGYGVGIERVIAWVCKLDNIKDAIPFPRTMLRKNP